MWQAVEQGISSATGEAFRVRESRPVGGGCINEAVCLCDERRNFFVKLNSADRLPMFEAEAAGLAAIRASGALRAPEPVAWGADGSRSWLALEYIPFTSPHPGTSTLLGEQLAAMHHATANQYGWERNNTIGSTPQPNPWTDDWVAFMREHRLGYQLGLAGQNGAAAALVEGGRRLLDKLPALFSDYRPKPSLLHGDLWGGNWGCDDTGQPVLFDPAVYYGDREADLAMTELFGGFDQNFYSAYRAAWPLEPGYALRKQLYNLYHILNHFNLFGGGYAQQAKVMVEQLLAELA